MNQQQPIHRRRLTRAEIRRRRRNRAIRRDTFEADVATLCSAEFGEKQP